MVRAQEEHLESSGPFPDVPTVSVGGTAVEEQIQRLTLALQLIGCVALALSRPPSLLSQEGWPGRPMG